jgi:hypothetical protein
MRLRAQAENGAAKPGARSPTSPQEQHEGTDLGRFPVLLAGLLQARDQPGQLQERPGAWDCRGPGARATAGEDV